MEPEDRVIGRPGGVCHVSFMASDGTVDETVKILQVVVTPTLALDWIGRKDSVVRFAG